MLSMAAISPMLLDHHVAPRRNERALGELALYDDANRLAGLNSCSAVCVNDRNNSERSANNNVEGVLRA